MLTILEEKYVVNDLHLKQNSKIFYESNDLRSEGIASLVNIGGVVDNDYLNVLYIINSKTIHTEGLFFKHEISQ